ERLEQERLEQERLEQERLEQERLEQEAKKLEAEADVLEKEAENMGFFEKLFGLDKKKRKEAAAKRTEAAAKRAEAAQIGNKSSYNARSFQRADFQRAGFQRVASSSSSGLFNVMVKGGLKSGYLTRSHDMSSAGDSATWGGLSNTGQPSDQLTIQYVNTTGRTLYDCEGKDIELDAHVITRYFIKESSVKTGKNKARKNLNLNCDAGRITSDDTLEDFMDSGATIIENIDQFNIRLGVQQTDDTSGISTYADMTVNGYMKLTGTKPNITNIRIAILARSTANSPDASPNEFDMFGTEQELKEQDDAPKYLRRVYESNILLRNARIMNIIETSVT
uniref:PilW family protein n=1 Tax=Psychrobacter frigidicola TaxID=45611 RepID=UPI001919944F